MLNVNNALTQANAENLVQDFHTYPFEGVILALTHVIEYLIEKLISVRALLVVFDPFDEVVSPIYTAL